MRKQIDAKGLACPKPVILAKKAIDQGTAGEEISVLVDNEIAVTNLRKLASSQGVEFTSAKKAEKEYEVLLILKQGKNPQSVPAPEVENCTVKNRKKIVAVLSSDKMGEGEEKLGHILMKGFVYALSQLEELPDTVLLYNKGAFLSCQGAETLEDLKLLEKEGVQILTCGTCLDFYGIKDKLAVGAVTNMYSIVQEQAQADLIIRP